MTGDVSDVFPSASLVEERSSFHRASSSSGAFPFGAQEGHEQSHVNETDTDLEPTLVTEEKPVADQEMLSLAEILVGGSDIDSDSLETSQHFFELDRFQQRLIEHIPG